MIALPLRLLLALGALAVAAFMGLQLSAERRLANSRDTVNEVRERSDPRREEAIRRLVDVAELQPGTEALLVAATSRTANGQGARAVALARRAASREPDNFLTWLTLAFAAKDVDRPAA